MNLDELPPEIQIKIFKTLQVKDALALSQTSKRLQEILNHPENALWRYYLDRDFPDAAQPLHHSECKAYYQAHTFLPNIKMTFLLIKTILEQFNINKGSLDTNELISLKDKLDNQITESPSSLIELRALYKEAKNIVSTHPINKEGDTVLMIATQRQHLNIIQALINYGVDVNKGNKSGRTPLMTANNDTSFTLLFNAGANIHAMDQEGFTVLNWHTCCNHTDVTLALIAAGADVNIPNHQGDTALIWATSKNNGILVSALLQAGAKKDATAKNGDTPLKIAERYGSPAIVNLLLPQPAAAPVVAWRAPVVFTLSRPTGANGYAPAGYRPF
jgi:hypothetical protein